MNQEQIKAVIKEWVTDIAILSEKIGSEFDRDTIHKFRVNVKKLRSFLRLLRMHTRDTKMKMPRKFKRLYQVAGAIRDAQLELEKMGDSLVTLPAYITHLQKVLERQKKEWNKHYSKKTIQKLETKLLSCKYEPLHPAVLQNFLTSRLETITRISNTEAPTDDQVHRIRKQVKDILYTAKMTQKQWKSAKKELHLLPIKKMNEVADAIGGYNDERTTLQHFHSFSSPAMKKTEAGTIEKICKKERTKLEKDKKNILTLVKSMLQPPGLGE